MSTRTSEMKIANKTAFSVIASLVVIAAVVFIPAGTLYYRQGWAFLAVFALSTSLPSIYLLRTYPAALERRMHGGPKGETRRAQKVIISIAMTSLSAMVVVSALDFRNGWSSVPEAVSILGDALIVLGIGLAMLAIVQNNYAAATITVESGQTLASTGLYRQVRHPMYTGNVVMMPGIPLALGSYWGLLLLVPGVIALVLRIRDEEAMLNAELPGYRDYTERVRYRLLPYVW